MPFSHASPFSYIAANSGDAGTFAPTPSCRGGKLLGEVNYFWLRLSCAAGDSKYFLLVAPELWLLLPAHLPPVTPRRLFKRIRGAAHTRTGAHMHRICHTNASTPPSVMRTRTILRTCQVARGTVRIRSHD